MDELSTSTRSGPLPAHWIESLFQKMLAEYGKRFIDSWHGVDPALMKSHWATRLGDLTDNELKRGVAALETRDWPPTLPEFRKLCRPTTDATVAYYEAVNGVHARDRGETGTWSHPAIYWAAAGMAFDLKNRSYSEIRAQWEDRLSREMAKGSWAPVPQPAPALPAPGKSVTGKEEAASRLLQLQASKSVNPKNEHRRWIRKIGERLAAGELLPHAVRRMYEDAIGEKTP